MTGRCRHALTRTSDVYFRMDWEDCWPLSFHYEPVLCFVCLPTAVASPKLRCREDLMVRMESMSETGLSGVSCNNINQLAIDLGALKIKLQSKIVRSKVLDL